jgi:ribose-phosphate pyrophosphokinase
LVTAGADRVVTFDLHASQEQGFFSCLEDDLSAIPLIGHVLYNDPEIDKENVVIVSPDHGGVNRARKVAEKLNAPLAIIDKRRNNKYQPEVMNIIGGVDGKDCVLIDDMIDTAGTVVAAANALKANGAKRVMMCAVHPVLSDPAYERLTTSHVLDKLIVTDSIPLDRRFVDNKDIRVQVISLAPHIAAIIDSINHDTSISVTSNMYKD